MPNAWVAVDAGIDPRSWARLLRRAYDYAASGSSAPTIVRGVVARSWERSEQAGVDPLERAPVMIECGEARRRFLQHPLAPLLPVIDSVLVDVAVYASQVVAIADVDGLVLWTGGSAETLRDAERIHLMPGARWREDVAGTNALGTALALDHPLQIFAAEHYKQSVHGWSSAAAPIHDSETDAQLGALSLSGPFKAAHPHGFSLVVAAAQIIEAHLAHASAQRDERLKVEYLTHVVRGCAEASAVVNAYGRVLLSTPPGWLGRKLRMSPDGVPLAPAAEEVRLEPLGRGDGFLALRGAGDPATPRPTLRLEALGCERARAYLDGQQLQLSPRHSEILVILAQYPAGLTQSELASALHGPQMKGVTVRAEISRLHKLLGPIIRTRPYRIAADVRADFLECEALLEAGAAESAAERCAGELLPSSSAPAIVALRERLRTAIDAA
jgi:hypothetical protein